MAKKKLTKEQKRMSHATAVSGNGSKADPYYKTDYSVGKRNPKREEKPLKETVDVMSVKQWVGTVIVLCIPLVNLIALIAWANKNNAKVNPTKRNFARAYLIVWLVLIVITVIVGVALGVALVLLFPFPTTPDKAVTLLEDASYTVEVYEDEEAQAYLSNENVEAIVKGISEDGKDYITIYYFSDEESAEAYFDEQSAVETDEVRTVGLSGNVVYIGTEDAVSAINGYGLF